MSFEQRLQDVARNALDASADALAPDVVARLASIRRAALAEAGAADIRPSRWAPRLAMAATLLLAVGVWTQTRVPTAESNADRTAPVDIAAAAVGQAVVAQADVDPLDRADLNRAPAEDARSDAAQSDAAQLNAAPVTAQIASAVVVDMALLDDLEFVAWMELEARDDAGGPHYEG